jgi:hypothetical protein
MVQGPNKDSVAPDSRHSISSSLEDQPIPLPTNSNAYTSFPGTSSMNKAKMKGRIGINNSSTARGTSISKSNFDCSEYSFERSQFLDSATSFDHSITMKEIMGNPAIFHKYRYPNLGFVLDSTLELAIAHTTKQIVAPEFRHSGNSKIKKFLYSPSTLKDYNQQDDPSLGMSSNYTVPTRQSLCSAPSPRGLSHQGVQHPHKIHSVSHNSDLLPHNMAALILRPRIEQKPYAEPSSSSSSPAGISTKKLRTSFTTLPTIVSSSKSASKNTSSNCERPTHDVTNESRLQEHFRNQNIRSERTQSIILESHLDKIFPRFRKNNSESEIAVTRQAVALSSSPSFDVKLHPNHERISELKATDARKKARVMGFKSDLSVLDLEAVLNSKGIMSPLKSSNSHSAVICDANNKREKGARGRGYGKRCIEKLMRTWSKLKVNIMGTSGSKAILSMWEGEADV